MQLKKGKKLGQSGHLGLWNFFLASLFFAFHIFFRSSISAISKPLIQEFSLGATGIGVLSSSYYIACVAFQIPFGCVLDMWGPKRVLRISMIFCMLGVLIFAAAPSFQWMIVGRIFLGLSGASVFLSAIRLSMLWFRPQYWGVSSGTLTATGKVLGGMLASIVFPLLTMHYTWRAVSYSLLFFGLILTVVNFYVIKDGPQDVCKETKVRLRFLLLSVAKAFSQPIVWALGVYGYAMYLVLSVFGETYAIGFLTQAGHTTRQQAGLMSSLAFLGSAVGSFVIAYASDLWGNRKIFLCLGAIGALITSSFVFFYPGLQYIYMAMAIFFFGFCSGAGVLVFVTAVEKFDTKTPGTLMSVVNCIVMSSGLVHNMLCGALIDVMRPYMERFHLPVTEYHVSFLSITIMLLIAVIISFSLKGSLSRKD